MLTVISALVLLLLMPGPTNTLLLRAGALTSFRRSWSLSLLECLAYLLQISFWGGLLSHIGDSAPWCLKFAQFGSIFYLIKTSYLLWRNSDGTVTSQEKARVPRLHFFLLTLINPKGLLVVSFIAPVHTFDTLPLYLYFIVLFTLVVIPVGCAWVFFGAHIKHIGHSWITPLNINRTASVMICLFAGAILSRLADSVINSGVIP